MHTSSSKTKDDHVVHAKVVIQGMTLSHISW